MTRNLDDRSGTALITGAARGIGAAFARQLAATRKRLLLVDKDEAALAAMPESLARCGPAEVELLAANLAQPQDQERVVARIEREEELCLLINNAGFGNPCWFFEQDPQVQCDMLQVHVVAPVRFCRAALPGMLKAGRGDIINVSALAAELPVAWNVMYGATKGFLRSFSQTLRVECFPRGVNVQLLCPGYTHTSFHDTPSYENSDLSRVPRWMWSTPDAVAAASLRALARRKFLCVPGRGEPVYRFLPAVTVRAHVDHPPGADLRGSLDSCVNCSDPLFCTIRIVQRITSVGLALDLRCTRVGEGHRGRARLTKAFPLRSRVAELDCTIATLAGCNDCDGCKRAACSNYSHRPICREGIGFDGYFLECISNSTSSRLALMPRQGVLK